MADLDLAKIAIEAGVSLLSGLGGLVVGAWKWGRSSAIAEHRLKVEFNDKIDVLREQTRTSMSAYEKQADARNDLLIQQFKESFEGIRRQIDDNRLDAERRFLPKNDFREWREEYRQDMRDIKESIAEVTKR